MKKLFSGRSRMKFLAAAFACSLFMALAGPAEAQQITRVAILDLSRTLAAFPQDVAALRNFEKQKAAVQAEVDKRTAEIKALQTKKSDAERQGEDNIVIFIESEIQIKTNALKDYVAARQNELDLLSKALSSGTSFLTLLNTAIAQVAEAEGYSLVLNLKPQTAENSLVLWNSPAIDITDKVIQYLSKSR